MRAPLPRKRVRGCRWTLHSSPACVTGGLDSEDTLASPDCPTDGRWGATAIHFDARVQPASVGYGLTPTYLRLGRQSLHWGHRGSRWAAGVPGTHAEQVPGTVE